jgi:hypothetical protein
MKSHTELAKMQLQALPYLLSRPTYKILSHSSPTIQRGVAHDLLNHVATFIELHETEERIQLL